MYAIFKNFRKSESGASLVEYAVALIVVTLIGGAGVIAIGGDGQSLAQDASDTTALAVTCLTGTPGVGGC